MNFIARKHQDLGQMVAILFGTNGSNIIWDKW
jgi:hypothetical protein